MSSDADVEFVGCVTVTSFIIPRAVKTVADMFTLLLAVLLLLYNQATLVTAIAIID
jgi:hypothetical protein